MEADLANEARIGVVVIAIVGGLRVKRSQRDLRTMGHSVVRRIRDAGAIAYRLALVVSTGTRALERVKRRGMTVQRVRARRLRRARRGIQGNRCRLVIGHRGVLVRPHIDARAHGCEHDVQARRIAHDVGRVGFVGGRDDLPIRIVAVNRPIVRIPRIGEEVGLERSGEVLVDHAVSARAPQLHKRRIGNALRLEVAHLQGEAAQIRIRIICVAPNALRNK